MSGHTPGPWTFGYFGCNGYCIQGGGKHIATSILYKKDGGEANSRLIAAAPELLAALQAIVGRDFTFFDGEMLGSSKKITRAEVLAARDAIAKATGSAS